MTKKPGIIKRFFSKFLSLVAWPFKKIKKSHVLSVIHVSIIAFALLAFVGSCVSIIFATSWFELIKYIITSLFFGALFWYGDSA